MLSTKTYAISFGLLCSALLRSALLCSALLCSASAVHLAAVTEVGAVADVADVAANGCRSTDRSQKVCVNIVYERAKQSGMDAASSIVGLNAGSILKEQTS